MVNTISDKIASKISERTYKDDRNEIYIELSNGKNSYWRNTETIQDKDTGLDRYVLQNPETDEIVISFRGTELPKTTTKKVEQKYVGSPSLDARLSGAGGGVH